jgi:histidyl-tRNA synthetase
LVKSPGRPDRTGIGFAAGLERLVLALPEHATMAATPRAFVGAIGDEAARDALRCSANCARPGLAASMEFEGRSLKAQMKRADRLVRASCCSLAPTNSRGEVTLRDMRNSEQRPCHAPTWWPRTGILEGQ